MIFFTTEIDELDCKDAWGMGYDAWCRGETDIPPFSIEELKKEWTEGYYEAKLETGTSGWGKHKDAISCPFCGDMLRQNNKADFVYCATKTCPFTMKTPDILKKTK